MKQFLFIFISLFVINPVLSQTNRQYETNPDRERTNQWIFGTNNLVKFIPNNQADTFKINTVEAATVFSNEQGRVVLYSNGESVWDSLNNIVVSGLLGNTSSSMGTIFYYHSPDSTLFLFNTNYAQSSNKELSYNVFKLSNTGIKVISKNIVIQTQVCEPIALIFSDDRISAWLVCHGFNNSLFYTFRISNGVVSLCPVISNTGFYNGGNSFAGQIDLKFSNDGKYLLKSNLNFPLNGDGVQVFSFDVKTGTIKLLYSIPNNMFPVMGIAFSSDSRIIYINERDRDLKVLKFSPNDSLATITSMKSEMINIGKIKLELQNTLFDEIASIMLDSVFLASVKSPNYFNSLNINQKGIKPKLAVSSTNGLPNFNQSYFFTPSIDFAYKYDCISNKITFEGRDTFYSTAHNWEIRKVGKPIEGTYSVKNIKHTFTDTGNYDIQFIAMNGNRSDTIKKTIHIYPKINKNFLGKDTFYGQGTSINKTLSAPNGMHCYFWLSDSSYGNTLLADSAGIYIARITNQAFCVVTDTITITECINDLAIPSIFRSGDTLYTYHQTADSFVWHRNEKQYKVTKYPFMKLSDTGTYRVEAAKKQHCNRSSSSWHVSKLDVSIWQLQTSGIEIYPNPADESIIIDTETAEPFMIKIFDYEGKLVLEIQSYTNKTNLDISYLTQGLYIIELSNYKTLFHYKLAIQ